MNNNNLLYIETNAFSSFKSVEWIDLNNNCLTFKDHTPATTKIGTTSPFNSCDSLQVLLLGNNSIKIIFPEWTSLLKLEKLDLSSNRITFLILLNKAKTMMTI